MKSIRMSAAAVAFVIATAMIGTAAAQGQSPLVGAWTLVSSSSKLPDGAPAWGANPIGIIIFTSSGHYSTQLMRSDLPKYASNNRAKGTPDEYKAIAIGSVANFGTYTVNEQTRPSQYVTTEAPFRTGKGPRKLGLSLLKEMNCTSPTQPLRPAGSLPSWSIVAQSSSGIT